MKGINTKQGQAALVTVLIVVFITMLVMGSAVVPVLRDSSLARDTYDSKLASVMAGSGVEDAVYRAYNGLPLDNLEVINVDGTNVTTSIVDNPSTGSKVIQAEGSEEGLLRRKEVELTQGGGASFAYGVHVGQGGLSLKNNARVVGNIYTSGPIEGEDNIIDGTAVSSGGGGSIEGVIVNDNAHANSISNSSIAGDAYYESITSSTVAGTEYPGSANQPDQELPITNETLDEWETAAADPSGTIINGPCDYEITTQAILGPTVISCGLKIKGNAQVTLTGPVWVRGDIEIENNAIIRIDQSLGNKSVAIIAHEPGNTVSGSTILIKNNAIFSGTGEGSSSVMLVSRNTSASLGGSNEAIEFENNALGDLILYAPDGLVVISNNADITSVAAHTFEAQNNAEIVYDSGIASVLFETGPTGGFSIGRWEEVE